MTATIPSLPSSSIHTLCERGGCWCQQGRNCPMLEHPLSLKVTIEWTSCIHSPNITSCNVHTLNRPIHNASPSREDTFAVFQVHSRNPQWPIGASFNLNGTYKHKDTNLVAGYSYADKGFIGRVLWSCTLNPSLPSVMEKVAHHLMKWFSDLNHPCTHRWKKTSPRWLGCPWKLDYKGLLPVRSSQQSNIGYLTVTALLLVSFWSTWEESYPLFPCHLTLKI